MYKKYTSRSYVKIKLKQTFAFIRNFHLFDEIRSRRHKSKKWVCYTLPECRCRGGRRITSSNKTRPLLETYQTAGSTQLTWKDVALADLKRSSRPLPISVPVFFSSIFLATCDQWVAAASPLAPLFLGRLPCRGGQTEGAKGPRREGHSSNSKYVSTMHPSPCGLTADTPTAWPGIAAVCTRHLTLAWASFWT